MSDRVPRIKPLEWSGDFAHTPVGLLYHVDHATGHVVLKKIEGPSTTKSAWDTIDAAKAEAQRHYERCIRSALV